MRSPTSRPRSRAAVLALATAVVMVLAGCGATIPTDPEGTLGRVRGGTLRVGVSPAEPWTQVDADGSVSGIEVDLVTGFAESLGAQIEVTTGGEEELVGLLEDGALEVVVGGLTSTTPWSSKVAPTAVYTEIPGPDGAPEKHVMLAPMGENAFLVELETYLRAQEVGVP